MDLLSRSALVLAAALCCLIPARADDAQAFSAWKTGVLPFSLKYDGKESSQFSGWTRTEEVTPSEGGETHRYTLRDPATSLKVIADVRTYRDYPAIDWVLHFTNEGQQDTPLIEAVQPLHWAMPLGQPAKLHWALGSNASPDDFKPQETDLGPGKTAQLNSSGGRSSNNNLPFFNVEDGGAGVFGAVGWTGNWVARFTSDAEGRNLALDAGMKQTHFVLHAGETVRTPRIVLLDWKGDRSEAQNLWRKFVLAYYSPREPDGKVVVVPASLGTWGSESVEDRKKTIDVITKFHVPLDVYWIDAGWCGNSDDWPHQRGNWTPNPKFFPPPEGLRAIGGYAHANGLGFLLWLEAETADAGSDMLTRHPGWYLRTDPNAQALLNLGDQNALMGMTEFVSTVITPSFITWYRQDFNVEPESYWAKNDSPDRVGITEMKDIEGLYSFWDQLRSAHPGLQIDNCASGGRRLDIETISRGVSLWRSDLCCGPFDAIANQDMTQGLNRWVPLNSGDMGPFGGPTPQATKDAEFSGTVPPPDAAFVYTARSAYSSGLTFGANRPPIPTLAPLVREFDQLRPFTTGDMYPLNPYGGDPATWYAVQWNRPDLKAGVLVCLRRPGNGDLTKTFALKGIDPAAQYDVEERSGFDAATPQNMTGADLANLAVTINDKPGSTIVFYKQR